VSSLGASLSLGATIILIILILQSTLEKKNVLIGSEYLSPTTMENMQILPAEAHRFNIEPFHINTYNN